MKTEFSKKFLNGLLSLLFACVLCWSMLFLVAHDFIQYNSISKKSLTLWEKDFSDEEKSNNADDENSEDGNKKITSGFFLSQIFVSTTLLGSFTNKFFHNYSDDIRLVHYEIVSPPPEI